MKPFSLFILGGLALLAAAAASAQQNLKGAGALTCTEFFTILEEAPETQKGDAVAALFSWVQGHASGRNLENPEAGQKDLTTLSPEYVVNQVFSFCSVDSELPIYAIAEAIYQGLPDLVVTEGTV
ncbi:MAG: hypothetical protein AAFW83_09695 [Pseudomonadota bacterium]